MGNAVRMGMQHSSELISAKAAVSTGASVIYTTPEERGSKQAQLTGDHSDQVGERTSNFWEAKGIAD